MLHNPILCTLSHAGSQVMGANTVGANTNSTDLDLNYGGFATRTSSAQPPAYSGGSTSHAPAPQYSAPAAMGHYGGYPGSGSGAAPAQTGGYYAPAQQQAMQQGVSLIDQVPSAAPSYPTYFQHASAPQPQVGA